MTIWVDTSNQRHLPAKSRLLKSYNGLKPTRAIFLDRDGVLVEDVHFLRNVSQLRILPGVCNAIRQLQAHFYILVVTNQSGIARGYLNEDVLLDIHTELLNRLYADRCAVDALYYCPHLPDAPLATYRQACTCRKPKPGMLLRAAKDWNFDLTHSFMIGDVLRDVQAGNAAGVRSFLIGQTHSTGNYTQASDLAACVPLILNADDSNVNAEESIL